MAEPHAQTDQEEDTNCDAYPGRNERGRGDAILLTFEVLADISSRTRNPWDSRHRAVPRALLGCGRWRGGRRCRICR
jgi:hypothetical protein